jgi:PhnB protein
MQLNPYLIFFAGQRKAAFKFYEKSLGGKNSMMMTYGESPMSEQVPTEWRGKTMHARMVVGDKSIAPPM